MKTVSRRAIALSYGALCHGLFAVAIAAMMANLWSGMQFGLGQLHGPLAWCANLALALQFPLVHSWLLTVRGRAFLARCAPRSMGRDLTSTTYAISAAIQLLATFVLWSPTGLKLWQPTGSKLWFFAGLFAASWLLLIKALHDGGLGAQTGWIGWSAVWRGSKPNFGPLATSGLFACCRQPIYLCFGLTLWTGPYWTADHLILASVWSIYCCIAPLHKERRYERLFGEAFAAYRRRVPYILPRLHR